jgi:hypothetical protein
VEQTPGAGSSREVPAKQNTLSEVRQCPIRSCALS